MNDISSLRHRIQGRPKLTYDVRLREDIVTHVKKRQTEGASKNAIEAELGIKWKTLGSWLDPTPKKMVPVKIKTGAILVSPAGWKVEGLSLLDLKTLVS